MNGEERYNKFVEDIDKWLKNVGLVDIRANEEVETLLEMNPSDLTKLTHDQMLIGAYNLTCYADYLQKVMAREQIAFDWAEDAIWYIVSGKLSNYGEKYAKWQDKYYSAVKENPIANQLLKVKKSSEAKIKTLTNHIDTVKKLSNILESLARRR